MSHREIVACMHERVMKRLQCNSTPPDLSPEEAVDPHVQFVVHMRAFVQRMEESSLIGSGWSRMGAMHRGRVHYAYMGLVMRYALELVAYLQQRDQTKPVDYICFVMTALASRSHGMFGHALHSMYGTNHLTTDTVVENQDKGIFAILMTALSGRVAVHMQAEATVAVLQAECPEALAACGFLALLLRTPVAAALLTMGEQNADGLSPLFAAMCYYCEPYRQRTPIDVVLCTAEGSQGFANEPSVLVQFERMVEVWGKEERQHAQGGPSSPQQQQQQQTVHASTHEQREAALLRLTRSHAHKHCQGWMDMARRVADWREADRSAASGSECPTVAEISFAAGYWLSVWQSAHRVISMARRLFERRHMKTTVVLWAFRDAGFCCFARCVPAPRAHQSTEAWAEQAADGFEREMRTVVDATKLHAPHTRLERRRANGLVSDPSRWYAPTLDATTAELMAEVRHAVEIERNGGSPMLVGQGGMRGYTSVAVVSHDWKPSPLATYVAKGLV